jgi:phosphate transport system substrate-binding protein
MKILSPKLIISLAMCWVATTVHAESLVIPGSGNPEYALGALAKGFNAQQAKHQVVIPPSTGTAGALRALAEGSASIGRVGRRLNDAELASGLRFVPFGRDPVVFVAGAGVAVRNITSAQVLDVYNGKVSNWQELGSKPGPIRAIGREVTDASRQALSRYIEPFKTIPLDPKVKVVNLDPQMIDLLDKYPTSLGFINRSALLSATTKLVPLSLDGIAATPDNVSSGKYSVVLEMGLIIKADKLTEAGRLFLAYIASAEGVRVLEKLGLVLPLAAR